MSKRSREETKTEGAPAEKKARGEPPKCSLQVGKCSKCEFKEVGVKWAARSDFFVCKDCIKDTEENVDCKVAATRCSVCSATPGSKLVLCRPCADLAYPLFFRHRPCCTCKKDRFVFMTVKGEMLCYPCGEAREPEPEMQFADNVVPDLDKKFWEKVPDKRFGEDIEAARKAHTSDAGEARGGWEHNEWIDTFHFKDDVYTDHHVEYYGKDNWGGSVEHKRNGWSLGPIKEWRFVRAADGRTFKVDKAEYDKAKPAKAHTDAVKAFDKLIQTGRVTFESGDDSRPCEVCETKSGFNFLFTVSGVPADGKHYNTQCDHDHVVAICKGCVIGMRSNIKLA